MRRQAATSKGLEKRLTDLGFEQVEEPRVQGKIKYSLPLMLKALVIGIITGARSLRRVEERTAQVAKEHGSFLGLNKRIADNTFGKLLKKLRFVFVIACLHRLARCRTCSTS